MQFKMHPDEKQGTLTLSGEVTLLQAEALLALLNQALEATDQVVIDCEGVTDIDMAGLQLMCAAHRSALGRGKQWVMRPNQPEVLAARAIQAGLVRQQPCIDAQASDCFWMGGKQ